MSKVEICNVFLIKMISVPNTGFNQSSVSWHSFFLSKWRLDDPFFLMIS